MDGVLGEGRVLSRPTFWHRSPSQMQRVISVPWSAEQYVSEEAYRSIVPESVCPNCGSLTTLHRHGTYERWFISALAVLLHLSIARFLCPECRVTISYLPDFCLSYRPLGPAALAAFLDGDQTRTDVRRFVSHLKAYAAALFDFAPKLLRTVGSGLGLAPPAHPRGVWPWLKEAGDSLAAVTRQLVGTFRVGLFRRYPCHQPKVL